MFELSAFERDVLTVIAGLDEPIGLEILAALETYYEAQINHGRLYPNLNNLADDGYLEKSKRDGRSNHYQLTESGKQLLEDRRKWEEQYFEFDSEKV